MSDPQQYAYMARRVCDMSRSLDRLLRDVADGAERNGELLILGEREFKWLAALAVEMVDHAEQVDALLREVVPQRARVSMRREVSQDDGGNVVQFRRRGA